MSLEDTLVDDLKTAMLARDNIAVSVLRMVKAELTNARISQGNILTDEQVMQVLKREVKKRRETAEIFRKAGESERAATEDQEAEQLAKYLPEQISEDVVRAYVTDLVSKLPGNTPPQPGILIKNTLEHFAGQADGKLVAGLVNELLK